MNKSIEQSYLGSLLIALYHTDNITRGDVYGYWKKFHNDDEHTLQEIVDYIEKDKKTKMDFSNICLVYHIDGEYVPLFTDWKNYNNKKVILPINPEKGYEGVLDHLNEDGYKNKVKVRFFSKDEIIGD